MHALRLKTHYGAIHLLDARTSTSDPLYREVTARGLDLDEGMAIAADGQIHHGADAVTFVSSADLAGLGTEGTRHVFLYEAAPQTLTQITQPSDSALLGASRRLSRGALWAIPWPLRGGGENGCAGCGCLRVVERGGEAMMKKR